MARRVARVEGDGDRWRREKGRKEREEERMGLEKGVLGRGGGKAKGDSKGTGEGQGLPRNLF